MGSGILGRSVLCPNLKLCMALMQCSLSQNRWPWPPCVSRRLILRSFSILDPSVEQGNVARQRSAAQICNNRTDAIFCIKAAWSARTKCIALLHQALRGAVGRQAGSSGRQRSKARIRLTIVREASECIWIDNHIGLARRQALRFCLQSLQSWPVAVGDAFDSARCIAEVNTYMAWLRIDNRQFM